MAANVMLPKLRPLARSLAAMRLEELTSHNWDMRLTLICLEGILNRSQSRLYLVQDRYAELWLDWLRERADIDRIEWLEVGQVFERFLPEVRQMFVTDPGISSSITWRRCWRRSRAALSRRPKPLRNTILRWRTQIPGIPDSNCAL